MTSLNNALASVRDQLHSARGDEATDSSTALVSKRKSIRDEDDNDSSDQLDDSAPILVFCRIRPSRGQAASKQVLALDTETKRVEFHIPKSSSDATSTVANLVNNTKESFKFNFNGIFDDSTTQEQMFEGIGKRVVENVLQGFNGTIFAYGQTGSGKTYSMTGGTSHYNDRGLIPRSLSYIFDWISQHTSEYNVSVRISYLEIYNDKGFDLLDPEHEHKTLEELPRVTLLENDGSIFFRNLGELPATTVDEALNLLFVGDTNRVICETPSNDASTRSHCIFIISLEMREISGNKVRRSKLNLVDLAGSERVKRTGVSGKILNEALHINVSLHYLEQVIVALHEASRSGNNANTVHIPYRNSMLTSVLRDSLGGSCKTVMLATLSPEKGHLDESISTSRFAQRVAQIKNHARLNEEVDPYVLVKQLKQQLREQREELAALREGGKWRPLDPDDIIGLRTYIQTFLRNDHDPLFDEPEGQSLGEFKQISMMNPFKVRACFEIWKEIVLAGGSGGGGEQSTVKSAAPMPTSSNNTEDFSRLQHENLALVDLLRKAHGGAVADSTIQEVRKTTASGQRSERRNAGRDSGGGSGSERIREREQPNQQQRESRNDSTNPSSTSSSRPRDRSSARQTSPPAVTAASPPPPPQLTPAELALQKLRAESFESFRRSYRKHTMVEEQKATHAAKVEQARKIGESINQIRNGIEKAKGKVEQHRVTRGVGELINNSSTEQKELLPDAVELSLRSEIDSLKAQYRSRFEELKGLKSEIDFLKSVIEKSRAQLQADFERWWTTQQQQQGGGGDSSASTNSVSTSSIPRQNSAPRLIADSAAAAVSGSAVLSSSSSSAAASQRVGRLTADSSQWANAIPTPSQISSSSRPSPLDSSISSATALRTTGNTAADADIARFYQMKEELLRQQQQQQQQQRR